jgi:hypothetical protein
MPRAALVRRLSTVPVCAVAVAAALLAGATPAAAAPIPDTRLGTFPAFIGAVATPQPLAAPDPPRHPFMAPNGRSNLHDDAYQTDTYQGYGPLGRGGIRTTSTFYAADCASVTFDRQGRIVTACVGLAGITLKLLDPTTLAEIATLNLPARPLGLANPFQNFSGGGYFYLDEQDRAVVPTANRHVYTVALAGDDGTPTLRKVADVDLGKAIGESDAIISALPDWSGRIWVASKDGVVATVDPQTGAVKALATGEGIGNSFAIDETGGVYIVTNAALYRFDAAADGTPSVAWREPYENTGTTKSGQSQAGSGTTPTLLGRDLVAITDNADPVNVNVYRRERSATAPRLVCKQSVFAQGASSTDQSLIGTPDFLIAENNSGYTGPLATELGQTTTPGLTRIDLDRDRGGCHVRWTSQEIAPSVVPKLSLAAGLVYTYTKPRRTDGGDPWYLTALDVRTGATVFKALSGAGLGFNNNYAPVTLGPDGAAYVGTLGGLVRMADAEPPPPLPGVPPARARLTVRCSGRPGHRSVVAKVTGPRLTSVRFSLAGTTALTDRRRPFQRRYARGRAGRGVTALVTPAAGAAPVTLHRSVPRCR